VTNDDRSPIGVARRFVDCINERDLDGLAALMSRDHTLAVFDEEPLAGKDANVDAWRGYFESFPRYVISPHRIAERNGAVAILGHTTGSHLGLADDEERELTLIWIASVDRGTVTRWQLMEDDAANRRAWALDSEPDQA
jgi:ketosteroid isomerase-like protein